MRWPSGENTASVSIEALLVKRFSAPPSRSIRYSCEMPSRDSVTASCRPSGDHAGAEFEPRKLATARRSPVATSCTITTALPASNDT